MSIDWNNVATVVPKQYVCGYCNTLVGPNQGYSGRANEPGRTVAVTVFICSSCNRPTFAGGTATAGQTASGSIGGVGGVSGIIEAG
jgi:hypothetical protein